MELHPITKRCYYIDGLAANVGVIRGPGENVLLVDCGLDKDQAKKLLKLLSSEGLSPEAIFVTHAHADHFGGAAHLIKALNIPCYAARHEALSMGAPLLEPLCLFGGAAPPKELRSRFLLAPEVTAIPLPFEVGAFPLPGYEEVLLTPLPGHAPEHMGLAVGDTLFFGDALLSIEILDKHGVPYIHSLKETLSTLDLLEAANYAHYVGGHCAPKEILLPEISAMRGRLDMLLLEIRQALTAENTFETLAASVYTALGLSLSQPSQLLLNNTTLLACLSYLKEQGEVDFFTKDNQILWYIKDKSQ